MSVVLHMDLRPAGISDDVNDTVDYKSLKQKIMSHLETQSFALIERMAYDVAGICLTDARVVQADVTIDKLGALRYVDSVQVELSRRRDD